MNILMILPMLLLTPAQASTDFSGTWERNDRLSQDPFAKIEQTLGGGQASGAGGREYDVFSRSGLLEDVNLATLRRMLLDYAEVIERVAIELEDEEMTVSVGSDNFFSLFYLDGEPHTRQLEGGLLLEATARREGDTVRVEQKGEAGGVIREVFSLLEGGERLAVIFQIEHRALDRPVMFRTVYDRAR